MKTNIKYRIILSIVLYSIIFLSNQSCIKLDSIAFPSVQIKEYLLDDYEGETDMELPPSYVIQDSMITHFTVTSQIEGETDSKQIHALYIGNYNNILTDTIILYCHGQRDHMDFYWPRAKLLANCGGKNRYGVLMMDYRGYGMSEGEPSEKGMYADVAACLDWLKEKGVDKNNIIIYGFSLGSAPATEHAAYYKDFLPHKLILESPFSSTDNISQESTIINFQASFIMSLELNNAEKIIDVDQPFMWMHGTEDDYVAISNGEIIFAAYEGIYKEAHRIEGAFHGTNGVPQTMGYDAYLDIVDKFIRRVN